MTRTPRATSAVDDAVDRDLVAGDGAGGEDQRVAASRDDDSGGPRGDPGKRSARLALATGDQRHHLVPRQVLVGLLLEERRQAVEHAELARRHRGTRRMARPIDHHLAAGRPRRRAAIDAEPANIRGERGEGDPPRPSATGRSRQARARPRPRSGWCLRAWRWSNRRRAPAPLPRRSRADARRRSARRRPASDRASSRRYGGRCRAGCGWRGRWIPGSECVTLMYSTSNGPTVKRFPGVTSVTGIDLASPARSRALPRAGRR